MVVVVLPASMWAMIPMLRTAARFSWVVAMVSFLSAIVGATIRGGARMPVGPWVRPAARPGGQGFCQPVLA
ncbi:hypothetical protein GCM10009603_57130 [Nocardiopsis exhalans]